MLARTGYATGPLQAALARHGVPHRVLGSLGLYERSEVKDALAYLTLLANPADAQAFRRAVGSPKRGVGTSTANRVVALARDAHNGDLIAASQAARTLEGVRSHAVRERLAHFGEGLARVRGELRAGRSLGHIVVATMMLGGGLVQHHQQRRDSSPKPDEREDAERVLEDLRSLCRAAQAYGDQHSDDATLTGFLEQAAGLHAHEIAPGEPDRRITVSTIHRSKRHGGAARRPARLRGAAAAVLARAAITRRRAVGRGATPVLRRLHPREGPADPHPCRHARRPAHRRTVPLPLRSRADRTTPRRSPPNKPNRK